MKFCPECGSVRNGEDKCFCGYNYITGEMEEKEEKNDIDPSFFSNVIFDNIPKNQPEPQRGLLETPPEWDPNILMKQPKFCPDCGKVIEDGKNDCTCGYKPLGAYVNFEELKKD